MSLNCPYCGKPAMLVDGRAIYPSRPDLAYLKFWQCKPCDAYVGCHKKGAPIGRGVRSDGTVPLGRMADMYLRGWKSNVHQVFDPLWKDGYMRDRNTAYAWLAKKMGIPVAECHIGMFTIERCRLAQQICTDEMAKRLQAEWTARFGDAA